HDALTAALVAGPSNGTVALDPDGSFDYTPNYHFVGTDTFTYKANDGLVDSNGATVTVNVVNNAPITAAQAYSVKHDTRLGMMYPGVLNGTFDPEGDSFTAAVVTPPSHGSLSFNPSGWFSYTPQAHYVGDDLFTFKANDGIADSLATPVVITVFNNTP